MLALPELCVTGYTCGDLFLQDTLLQGAEDALSRILEETAQLDMLTALGLPVSDWLHSSSSFWVAEALYLWKNTGYSVILLLSGLVTIPEDHYGAARLDGATAWQRFRYITMPQMWYSIFFAVVFSLINAFKCFREIFLIGGTSPHEDIYMLQHFISNSFEHLSYPKLAVASVLLLLVVTAAFALLYGWVRRKEEFRA